MPTWNKQPAFRVIEVSQAQLRGRPRSPHACSAFKAFTQVRLAPRRAVRAAQARRRSRAQLLLQPAVPARRALRPKVALTAQSRAHRVKVAHSLQTLSCYAPLARRAGGLPPSLQRAQFAAAAFFLAPQLCHPSRPRVHHALQGGRLVLARPCVLNAEAARLLAASLPLCHRCRRLAARAWLARGLVKGRPCVRWCVLCTRTSP